MECIFLLLGETICNSSVQVKYLPTDPPTQYTHAIRPISILKDDDDDPYWKNQIEKYFAHPENEIFNDITYSEYFKNYKHISKSPVSHNKLIYKDKLNYFVIKRITPIIVRFRYLKVEDGETFFY